MRRQIEDVIFHDPGRNDKHRLRANLAGRGRVLDQLDQSIAVNDLAGGDCQIAADREILGADRLLSADGALPIFRHIAQAGHQVHPAFADGLPKYFRIGRQKIRGRDHVENLARDELHHLFVMLGDAADAGGRVVPPLLLQQKSLRHEIERRLLPIFAVEPAILRQRFDAARRLAAFGHGADRIIGETHRLSRRLVDELHPFAG